MVRIYAVAIFVLSEGIQDVIYVGDAIEIDEVAWLVLNWEDDEKLRPSEKLLLEEDKLVRQPPAGISVEADWHYVIRMAWQRTLQ